jgi:hypothetical protein
MYNSGILKQSDKKGGDCAMKLVIACKKFFGLLPNQTLAEFANEVRELAASLKPGEHVEFARLLEAELGEPVEMP